MTITMIPNRIALIAEDQTLGASLQASFKKNLDLSVPIRSFQLIRECLGRDTDGIAVIAVGSVQDLEQAFRLVQEISIQDYPVRFVIAQSESLTAENRCLTDRFAMPIQEFGWPGE